jgi:hypothetical protein
MKIERNASRWTDILASAAHDASGGGGIVVPGNELDMPPEGIDVVHLLSGIVHRQPGFEKFLSRYLEPDNETPQPFEDVFTVCHISPPP